MAFVWVQQWVPLPVVYEQHMGDLPPGPRPQAMDNATTGLARDGNTSGSVSTSLKSPDSNDPFYSQLSGLPQSQLRPEFRSHTHVNGSYQPQEHGTSPLNMGAMTGTLPSYNANDNASMNPQTVPRSLSGASTSAVAYQLGQNLQMPPGNMSTHAAYGPGFATGLSQQPFMPQQGSQYSAYPSFATTQSRLAGAAPMHPSYQNYQQASQYMYYPVPYGPQGQFNPGFSTQSQAMYERKASSTNTGMQGQAADYSHVSDAFSGVRMTTGNFLGDSMSPYSAQFTQSSGKYEQRAALAHV